MAATGDRTVCWTQAWRDARKFSFLEAFMRTTGTSSKENEHILQSHRSGTGHIYMYLSSWHCHAFLRFVCSRALNYTVLHASITQLAVSEPPAASDHFHFPIQIIIIRSDIGTFLVLILVVVRIRFGRIFLDISWIPGDWCFATRIMRNACFCFSSPPIFTSKIHPKLSFL